MFAAQCAVQGAPETKPESKSENHSEHRTEYKPAAVTSLSIKGEELFKNLNCMSCHQVHGVGGDIGPALDGVGGRRNREFLTMRLLNDPDEVERFARMPGVSAMQLQAHIRLSRESTEAISAFLQTLPDPPEGFAVYPHISKFPAEKSEENPNYKPAASSRASARGKRLFTQYGCVACHSVGSLGGWAGPPLDGVGGKHSRAYIAAHISNPGESAGASPTRMPAFKIDEHDRYAIVDYLLTLPNAAIKTNSK